MPTTAAIEPPPLSLRDALTGFGSRGKLIRDLERTITSREPSVLAIFDLAGLEEYQRLVGEQAADELTARISLVFARAIGNPRACYRPRHDEFAVLGAGSRRELRAHLVRAERALASFCEPYLITSSFGLAGLPDEAGDPIGALTAADRRLREVSGRPPRRAPQPGNPTELASRWSLRNRRRSSGGRRTAIPDEVVSEVASATLPLA